MISDNLRAIINQLINKTKERQAVWNKTSRSNEFKLVLEKGAITTDSWWDPERETDVCDLSIYNSNGDKIETIIVDRVQPEDYSLIKDLNDLARKSFFKVEETFENILNEIKTNKVIGTTTKKDESSDDLPF